MIINSKTIIVGTVAVVVLYYLSKYEIISLAKDIGPALNPVSNENIFNRAANAVTQKLTGNPNTSLGSTIYDWLHPDETQNSTDSDVRQQESISQ